MTTDRIIALPVEFTERKVRQLAQLNHNRENAEKWRHTDSLYAAIHAARKWAEANPPEPEAPVGKYITFDLRDNAGSLYHAYGRPALSSERWYITSNARRPRSGRSITWQQVLDVAESGTLRVLGAGEPA